MTNSMYFALIAMFLWGIAPLFAKWGLAGIEPLAALTIRSGIITLILAAVIVVSGRWPEVLGAPPREVLFIGLEGICAALLGQLAYYYALRGGAISQVTPVAAAFPLVALLAGMLILGEKITIIKVLGAVFIVIGMALINYR